MRQQNRHDDSSAHHLWLSGPFPEPCYRIDTHLCDLDFVLKGFSAGWGFALDPDNQHGHPWSQAQQVAFVEGFLRGTLSDDERLIRFNCPHWDGEHAGDLPHKMQIVDGVQRLTAILQFLAGNIRAFGMLADSFNGTRYDIRRQGLTPLRIAVHAFGWRHDLLQFYLEINSGGTPRRDVELARVRNRLRLISHLTQ